MCPAALQVELNKDRHSHGVGAASRVQAPSSPFCELLNEMNFLMNKVLRVLHKGALCTRIASCSEVLEFLLVATEGSDVQLFNTSKIQAWL